MTLSDIENGIVLAVDKPYGWSSFQVVNKIKWQIKRQLGIKKFKIGHAGTLDPLATGLLLICVGKATKSIEQLQQGEKVYSGTIVLGATTPCYDMEQAVDRYYPAQHIDKQLLESTRQQFLGEIQQVPPMFSAIKVEGSRAYQYARDGEPVEIAPKLVMMYEFDILDTRNLGNADVERIVQPKELPAEKSPELYRNPQGHIPEGLPQVDFRIRCGKGTYIRSIARDFGLAMGSGAFLSSLRRERVGDYSVDNALTISSGEDMAL